MGGVAENWETGSETAHNFSEMTVAKASMFEGDCGYRRLFEQVDLLTSLVCLRSAEVTAQSLPQKARSSILDCKRLLSEP
jgi:hypothetical protein